jgi:hypothetical protein
VGQDSGGDDDTGGNGELPFTGPDDTLLPAGTALLLAGLALAEVVVRHADLNQLKRNAPTVKRPRPGHDP